MFSLLIHSLIFTSKHHNNTRNSQMHHRHFESCYILWFHIIENVISLLSEQLLFVSFFVIGVFLLIQLNLLAIQNLQNMRKQDMIFILYFLHNRSLLAHGEHMLLYVPFFFSLSVFLFLFFPLPSSICNNCMIVYLVSSGLIGLQCNIATLDFHVVSCCFRICWVCGFFSL